MHNLYKRYLEVTSITFSSDLYRGCEFVISIKFIIIEFEENNFKKTIIIYDTLRQSHHLIFNNLYNELNRYAYIE